MPKGPKGQKRPADVIANAVHVMRIATGEAEDVMPSKRRKGGLTGGKARAQALTSTRRSESPKNAPDSPVLSDEGDLPSHAIVNCLVRFEIFHDR